MEQFIAIASDIAHGAGIVIAFIYTYVLKFILDDIGILVLACTVFFIAAASLKSSRRDVRHMHMLMNQQTRANTLNTVNLAWTSDLRDTLAGYMSCCDALSAMFAENQTVNSHFLDTMRAANEYEGRLSLLLNPDIAEQKSLLDAVKIAAMHISNYHAVDKAPLIDAGQTVFRAAAAAIKTDTATLPVPYKSDKTKPWHKRLWLDLTE
jgi:hypothetical protein